MSDEETGESVTVSHAGDARFTLAAERTALAWLRTALGLLVAGVAVLHLVDPAGGFSGRVPLGNALLVLGSLTAVVGTMRWLKVRRALHDGGDLPGPLPIIALTGMFVAVSIAFVIWS